jgi:Ras-related protein Rab-32
MIISTPRGDKNEYLFKMLVVGDSGSGKTSFIKRYVHGVFTNQYRSTIGVDFAFKHVQWDNNLSLKLQLWDIAGQERFSEMTRVYYREAVAVLIFFDVSAGEKSLRTTRTWKLDADKKVFFPNGEPVPCILIGNKCDLLHNGVSPIPEEQMENFCRTNGYDSYFLTSAKEGTNVEEAMNYLLQRIIECTTRLIEEEAVKQENRLSMISTPRIVLSDSSARVSQNNNTSDSRKANNLNTTLSLSNIGGGCC